MARRKRSKGDKPEGQQLPISFEATTPEPQPEERVLAFQLRPGDRVAVAGQEWEVAERPETYQGGKMVRVRFRKPGDAAVTEEHHWSAHERVNVKR